MKHKLIAVDGLALLGKTLVIILAIQLFNGCMALPGRLVPTVTSLPDKTSFVNKPTVFLDVNFHTYLKGKHTSPVENIDAKDLFINVVKEVTEESKLFENYTLDRFESRDVDFTIQMDMLNSGDNTKAMLAGCVSGLTLMIIPMAATDNYTLTATLVDHDGNEINEYVYEDYMKTWFHLVLFPFLGTIKKVPLELWGNMIKSLYRDILNDNYFNYSYNEMDLPGFSKQIYHHPSPESTELTSF